MYDPERACCLHVYYRDSKELDRWTPYALWIETTALGIRVWVRERDLSLIYLWDGLDITRRRDLDYIL